MLKEDSYLPKGGTGALRYTVKIVAERIALVAPPQASHAGGERSGSAGNQQLRMGESSMAAYRLYSEGKSSFPAVAAARGIAVSTAIEYVMRGALRGLPLDWADAAAELQLGPKGSVSVCACVVICSSDFLTLTLTPPAPLQPWMTGDDVFAAMERAHMQQRQHKGEQVPLDLGGEAEGVGRGKMDELLALDRGLVRQELVDGADTAAKVGWGG